MSRSFGATLLLNRHRLSRKERTEAIREATYGRGVDVAFEMAGEPEALKECIGSVRQRSFTYWADKNLSEGNCDLAGLGRQSFADPLFAQKILSGLASKINFCLACGGCSALLRAQAPTGCVVYFDFYKNLFGKLRSAAPG
jgi:2,4-dienoyl-CoA reductase-like NADH-dependent reductase (Old Yellow Enzyme family)